MGGEEKHFCLFELEQRAKTCYNAVNRKCQVVRVRDVGYSRSTAASKRTQDIVGAAAGNSVKLPSFNVPHIVIHTHPGSGIFSHTDLTNFVQKTNLKLMTALGHSGHVYAVEKTNDFNFEAANKLVQDLSKRITIMADIPKRELSNDDFISKVGQLVENGMKELEQYGIKFYQ